MQKSEGHSVVCHSEPCNKTFSASDSFPHAAPNALPTSPKAMPGFLARICVEYGDNKVATDPTVTRLHTVPCDGVSCDALWASSPCKRPCKDRVPSFPYHSSRLSWPRMAWLWASLLMTAFSARRNPDSKQHSGTWGAARKPHQGKA